jgi:hypothetical protein
MTSKVRRDGTRRSPRTAHFAPLWHCPVCSDLETQTATTRYNFCRPSHVNCCL